MPLIKPAIEEQLYTAIAAKCRDLKCQVLAIGGDADHIHQFVRFPTTLAAATLVKEVKGASSHLVNHSIAPDAPFKWQGGYGAFTVSKRRVDSVVEYVKNQKARHSNRQVIEELECCETEEAAAP